MVLSCAEPLALPSRSPLCSSLSGPQGSALSPAAWSSKCHWIPRLPMVDYSKNAPAELSRGAAADPYIPGQMRLLIAPHRFPGSQATGESDGISRDAINISVAFLWSVYLTFFYLPPPSECSPGGISSLTPAQTEQGREEGQALRQMEKGKEGRRKAERRGGGGDLEVESPVAERLMESLSLSLSLLLPPTLSYH